MNQLSVSAFEELEKFEVLLRRFVRWQLIGKHGRSWLTKIGDSYYDLILKRIEAEKRQGLYWARSSELSFLTLSELISVIFRELWDSSSRAVFSEDYGLKSSLQRTVVPLRNRIAHFRVVDAWDLRLLEGAIEVRDRLKNYYSSQNLVLLYLSSDPQLAEEQIDDALLIDIRSKLTDLRLDHFWVEYGKFESVRSHGVGCGFGIYDSNIFLEIDISAHHCNFDFYDWIDNFRFVISSIVLNKDTIRFFLPSNIENTELRKVINSLQRQIGSQVTLQNQNPETRSEYIIDARKEEPIGLAF